MSNNPFLTPTPENITANEMVKLFVPEFKDFHAVKSNFHTIISGPRGTGKSTILRYMQPDCQKLEKNCSFKELDWIGVLVKFTGPVSLPELTRLEKLMGHAFLMVTEHSLVLEVLGGIIETLNDHLSKEEKQIKLPDEDKNEFSKIFAYSDKDIQSRIQDKEEATVDYIAYCLNEFFHKNNNYLLQYNQKLIFPDGDTAFESRLVAYNDFLYPLLKAIRKFSWTPDVPIYLLFDDADSLGKTATSIINSWISVRTTNEVCIKLATLQNKYPTFISSRGKRIETPHDFYDFSVNEIYTTNFDTYQSRIKKIVEKRLEDTMKAHEFFPSDPKQDAAIEKIRQGYLTADTPRGHIHNDDAYRYAVPDYIKELSGTAASGSGSRKQGSKFKYAGFKWLVHISSGNTRDFLNAAFEMYNKQRELCADGANLTCISPDVQDEYIRKFSENFLKLDFASLHDKLKELSLNDEVDNDAMLDEHASEQLKQLGNLIEALGGIFRLQLRSDSSERRIFSIAFSDGPTEDVQAILDIGVTYGYFQCSTIGNKTGTGRVPLYILSRRLAPYFGLDPTGFAGYKFIKNSVVRFALENPRAVINKVHQRLKNKKDDSLEEILEPQGDLFNE